MNHDDATFEIHVHGDVKLRPDVRLDSISDALKPLWKYAGARSLTDGASSLYEDEPGIRFDAQEHLLQICWTLRGEDDFRHQLDDLCMNLNELSREGSQIEVTFYDTQFDDDDEDDDEDDEREARDDFVLLFIGPTPQAIMQAQRDLLVEDMVALMERHFDGAELGGVVGEIDKLFESRYSALTSSLELGRPRNPGGGSGHGGNRRPRHLH
jgi:hypothetical protein